MKKREILLVSHGELAHGMRHALTMLVGNAEHVDSYGLMPGEMPETIAQSLEAQIHAEPDTRFYILADLLCGSVSNAVTRLSLLDNVTVINGMNLPLVIGLYFSEPELSGEELETLIQQARAGICMADLQLIAPEDAAEEEDLIL